jgi:hypothetical protein
MQRFFIILANCVLLAFLFIGIPTATRAQIGNWQISKAPTAQTLMFWGLAVATAANIFAALFLIKGRKERVLGWEWAAVFGVLWFVQYSIRRGWINFEWLKHILQWLQAHL